MNKIEFRALIKKELVEILNSKQGRQLIHSIIKEGVRLEVDRLLTEMEQSEQTERIDESPRVTQMVERGELPPRKPVPKKEFAKDPVLNKILNETFLSMVNGDAVAPASLGKAPTNMVGEYGPDAYRQSSRSVEAMLPETDVNGRPLQVSPEMLPDHVRTALTKDYRKLMKKIDEKK